MQTGANIYSTISISGEKELDLSGFQPWLGCQYEPETRTKAFVDQSIEFALTEFFASESGQDPIVLDVQSPRGLPARNLSWVTVWVMVLVE